MVSAAAPTAHRSFVPRDVDPGDFAQIQPLYLELIERRVDAPAALRQWLDDLAELTAVVDEFGNRRYIDKTCSTEDEAVQRAYLHFIEQVEPKVKPLFFRLQRKFLDSPARPAMEAEGLAVLGRNWAADVEVFREVNVPLETKVTKLANDYDKVMAAMMVPFRGAEYTPQQLARFIEEPDRDTRREAWEASTHRRLQDRERIESFFEAQLPLREQIARNAGLPDFRAFMWKRYKRFDYTPDDCLRFADAIGQIVAPLNARLNAERAAALGLPSLRPWDLDVDPLGRAPLRPFVQDQTDLFVSRTREIFHRLSPDLARDFDELSRHGNLDLASRRGKQPGGYQCALDESRQPFIFMNAAGVHRDVETLLHEGGHAFHYLASRRQMLFLRPAPMEFCEVASMSMELLGSDHLEVFYPPDDAARARRKLLEGIVRFLPWMAVIDSFQHWLYTHPGHDRAQRTAQWLSLMARFTSGIDWTGHELAQSTTWHRQLHLFQVPFYYVEYGIAQLGALQL